MNRRKFITNATAASGLLILKSKTAFGYQANSAVRLGLLGCGNRGTSVATSFANNTGARIVALADIFPDQLSKGKTHFDAVNGKLGHAAIDPKLMFRGIRRSSNSQPPPKWTQFRSQPRRGFTSSISMEWWVPASMPGEVLAEHGRDAV